MKQNREELIDSLAENVAPVTPMNIPKTTALWLLGAFASSIVFLLLVMPFRKGFWTQLMQSNQFLFESLFGFVAILLLVYSAIRSAIPSGQFGWRSLRWPLALFIAWIALYVFGYIEPALTPSHEGMRPHCSLEVMLYSIPAMIAGIYIVKKQWAIQPMISGLLVGLAAGAVPALLMQFACAYDTTHILLFHILPGLLMGIVGALIAKRWIKHD